MNEDEAEEVSVRSQSRAKSYSSGQYIKGVSKDQYANLVEQPIKNYLTHRDEGRSKFSTGKFFENCNKQDKFIRENPKVRYLDYKVPDPNDDPDFVKEKQERDRVVTVTHVGVHRDMDNEDNYSEVSKGESNRSLPMHTKGGKFNRVIGVISKPFKTEYNHEYGGGRLDSDPRREGHERWYVPNVEPGKNRDIGLKGSIFYKRKNNKITGYNDGYNCPANDRYKSL